MLLSIVHRIVFEYIKGKHMLGDNVTRGISKTEIVYCCASKDIF